MHILICNGSLFQRNSFSGGSELSFEYLARYLSKKHSIHVITRHVKHSVKKRILNRNLTVSYVHDDEIRRFLNQELQSQRYDYVFTQLIWSDVAMKVCAQTKTPCVYFVRSVGVKIDLSRKNIFAPAFIVANSNFVKKKMYQLHHRGCLILYSSIDFDRVKVKNKKQDCYIGMFNPIKGKGGDTFAEIAKMNPDEKFLAVRGWTNFRKQNNDWDMETMRLMTRAHGRRGSYAPEEARLSDIPNIRFVDPSPKPKIIYSKLKLLLVPSIWEETFCRVVLEAMSNGIPVMASKRGGIPETSEFGEGGTILIEDYKNAETWSKEIKRVLADKQLYRSLATQGRKVIENFRTNEFIDEFANQLEKFRIQKTAFL